MEDRQTKTVYGYVRNNHKQTVPEDIISMIIKFYFMYFNSNILTLTEQNTLLNVLCNKFKYQGHDIDDDMIKDFVNSKLLFRASEHNFSMDAFHKNCDDQSGTVTVICNELDHIFGFYTNNSWNSSLYSHRGERDDYAFVWKIRPSIGTFSSSCGWQINTKYTWGRKVFGMSISYDTDIYIYDKHEKEVWTRGCFGKSLYDPCDLIGANKNIHNMYEFDIKEYEVFSLSFE